MDISLALKYIYEGLELDPESFLIDLTESKFFRLNIVKSAFFTVPF